MHDFICFLRCVARSMVQNGEQALTGLTSFSDVLPEVANGAYQEWRRQPIRTPPSRQLEGLAQADPAEVQQAAEDVAGRESAGKSAKIRPPLTAYLAQVRWSVRQSLRRPADPAGRTALPELCPRDSEELAKFLPARLSAFKPGDRPLPGWELVELLGQSSFGEVWKVQRGKEESTPDATSDSSFQTAAVKFCLEPGAVARLRSEPALQLLDRVQRHGRACGMAALLETHLHGEPPCLVYEHVEGSDLAGFIRERQPQGRLSPERASGLVQELARSLAVVHELDPPLVHGNLKLRNVLVRPGEGDEVALRMADFGIGGLLFRPAIPERTPLPLRRSLALAGGRRASLFPSLPPRSENPAAAPHDDVHALGVIWYQLATGNPGPVPADWRDVAEERGLADQQIRLLACCLEPQVEKRPASAAELEERLAVTPPVAGNRLSLFRDEGGLTSLSPRGRARAAKKPDPKPGTIESVWLGQGIEMKFTWIPAGSFLMGSAAEEPLRNDDEIQHWVKLTQGFYLAVHPATQAQWRAVMGGNPSRFKDANRPVDTLSWENCVDFCRQLRQKTARRYRLPSEAEWEYACRAGTATAYHGGNDVQALKKLGWCSYDDNPGSARETKPVGQLQPNAWGLFDMHGNVWEWCADWYGPYESGEQENPVGPGFGARVLRGGSWYYGPRHCRSARRARRESGGRYTDFGCRIVLLHDSSSVG